MGVVFGDRNGKQKRTINEQRRDKKKKTDMLKNKASMNELKVVFNTVYKDQVAALYNAVASGK